MGYLESSTLGLIRGKIGNVVFYPLNGKQVVRSIGIQGKPSIKQLANYQAMSVTMILLSQMKRFISSSFAIEAKGTNKNAHNLAVSYNKKQAIQGVYPNLGIDYSKVVLSYGDLEVAEDLAMEKSDTGVSLRWNPSNLGSGDRAEDMVMIMLHFPATGESRHSLNAAKRETGYYSFELEPRLRNESMEVYVCFKDAEGKLISNSVYLGNLNGAVAVAEADETVTIDAVTAKSDEKEQAEAKYNKVKAQFERVSNTYMEVKVLFEAGKAKYKTLRHVEMEYMKLREQLDKIPGKPLPAG